ncbi:protein Smg [Nitrosomonas stercoris]|uniref:Protein Smg n=1 Tax=Nitrosomonas stercoris TaxID=1444684 RepID=A0A4Y1YL93_9PROT|nr:protein Smg [Nitrosomonas stercoris]
MARFGDEEITLTLDWLSGFYPHDTEDDLAELAESNSMRYFTEEEMEVIDTEGRGFIFFLEQAGVINPAQRELLIERIIRMDGEVTSVEKIKLVVLLDFWIQKHLADDTSSTVDKLFIVGDFRQQH